MAGIAYREEKNLGAYDPESIEDKSRKSSKQWGFQMCRAYASRDVIT